jgi:hypothetical protein
MLLAASIVAASSLQKVKSIIRASELKGTPKSYFIDSIDTQIHQPSNKTDPMSEFLASQSPVENSPQCCCPKFPHKDFLLPQLVCIKEDIRKLPSPGAFVIPKSLPMFIAKNTFAHYREY